MTSQTRRRLAFWSGGVVGVAAVVAFLAAWAIRTPKGWCLVHVGMSREAVVEACGKPELDWRPPDYRDASLLYFFDYYDIDKASCPGPAYVYGTRSVVFKWEGGVATVQGRPGSVGPNDGADAVRLCGPTFVARQLALARQAAPTRNHE